MTGIADRGSARIVLAGHRDAAALVSVREMPLPARMLRTAGMAALWGSVTATTFFVTIFDPFMTSMPALVGMAAVWRSWRGRYRVDGFRGECPRCGTALRLKRGARVSTPHPLVCYACHHEPHLVLA